jgi:hypothetical protein
MSTRRATSFRWASAGSCSSTSTSAHCAPRSSTSTSRAAPQAIAYYEELRRRARRVYHLSPFKRGADPVAFNFDWSIDYYPSQYQHPGPEIDVYRLTGGRCT